MAPATGERGSKTPRPLTALPSVGARVLAFVAILTAGVCGGLIGYSTTKVGCSRDCSTPDGVGGIIGAVVAAGGVAIIAVLVLRAMGEWRSIKETHQMETMIAAASEALATTAPPVEVAAPDEAVPLTAPAPHPDPAWLPDPAPLADPEPPGHAEPPADATPNGPEA